MNIIFLTGAAGIGLIGGVCTFFVKEFGDEGYYEDVKVTTEVERVVGYEEVESTDEAKKIAYLRIQKQKEDVMSKSQEINNKIYELKRCVESSYRIISKLQKTLVSDIPEFLGLGIFGIKIMVENPLDQEQLTRTNLQNELNVLKLKSQYSTKDCPEVKNQIRQKESELEFLSESIKITQEAIKCEDLLTDSDIKYLKDIQFKHELQHNEQLNALKSFNDNLEPYVINNAGTFVDSLLAKKSTLTK